MSVFLSAVLWILIGSATGYYAKQRGRDPVLWFVIGLLLGIFGLLFLFLLPQAKEDSEDRESEKTYPYNEEPLEAVVTRVDPPSIEFHNCLIKDWFYLNGEQQQGPVHFEILKNEWEQGKITENTFVWCEGMENWQRVYQVEDLKKKLQEVPVEE